MTNEAFAQGSDLVEFRIDLLRSPSFEEIKGAISPFLKRSVVTVRPTSEGGGFDRGESERLELLRRLGGLAPAYIDVELRTLERSGSLTGDLGEDIIVSWHDARRTGDGSVLYSIAKRAASYGGLVKIVTMANTAEDNLSVLSLYDSLGAPPIAFCMGSLGVFSRVMSLGRGSPIAYASIQDEPTALGQLSLGQLIAVRRRLQGA